MPVQFEAVIAAVLEPLGQAVCGHAVTAHIESARTSHTYVSPPVQLRQPAALLEDLLHLLQTTVGEPVRDDGPGLKGCLGVPEVLSQPQGAFSPFPTRPQPIAEEIFAPISRTPLPAPDWRGAARARR